MPDRPEEKVEVLFAHPAPVVEKVVYEPYLEIEAEGHMATLYLRKTSAEFSEGKQHALLRVGCLISLKTLGGVTFRRASHAQASRSAFPGVCFDDQGRVELS